MRDALPPESMMSIADIATRTALSRTTIERLKSSGKLPLPDLQVCRNPRWHRRTIEDWIAKGGRQ